MCNLSLTYLNDCRRLISLVSEIKYVDLSAFMGLLAPYQLFCFSLEDWRSLGDLVLSSGVHLEHNQL